MSAHVYSGLFGKRRLLASLAWALFGCVTVNAQHWHTFHVTFAGGCSAQAAQVTISDGGGTDCSSPFATAGGYAFYSYDGAFAALQINFGSGWVTGPCYKSTTSGDDWYVSVPSGCASIVTNAPSNTNHYWVMPSIQYTNQTPYNATVQPLDGNGNPVPGTSPAQVGPGQSYTWGAVTNAGDAPANTCGQLVVIGVTTAVGLANWVNGTTFGCYNNGASQPGPSSGPNSGPTTNPIDPTAGSGGTGSTNGASQQDIRQLGQVLGQQGATAISIAQSGTNLQGMANGLLGGIQGGVGTATNLLGGLLGVSQGGTNLQGSANGILGGESNLLSGIKANLDQIKTNTGSGGTGSNVWVLNFTNGATYYSNMDGGGAATNGASAFALASSNMATEVSGLSDYVTAVTNVTFGSDYSGSGGGPSGLSFAFCGSTINLDPEVRFPGMMALIKGAWTFILLVWFAYSVGRLIWEASQTYAMAQTGGVPDMAVEILGTGGNVLGVVVAALVPLAMVFLWKGLFDYFLGGAISGYLGQISSAGGALGLQGNAIALYLLNSSFPVSLCLSLVLTRVVMHFAAAKVVMVAATASRWLFGR